MQPLIVDHNIADARVSVSQFLGFISSILSLPGALSATALLVRREPLDERRPEFADEDAERANDKRPHLLLADGSAKRGDAAAG